MGCKKATGYAFVDFDAPRYAQDVIRDLNDKHNLRVELSHWW